mgnify:CR=1 FL=1
MASIVKDPNGRKRLMIRVKNESDRKPIRIGKMDVSTAKSVAYHVGNLEAAALSSATVPQETALWLGLIDDGLRAKLSRWGLCEPPAHQAVEPESRPAGHPLGEFIRGEISKRADIKESTRLVFGHSIRCLTEYFGEHRFIETITPGDMDDWLQWLIGDQKLATPTVRRRSGIARQFFRAAVRKRIITENPAAHLKATVGGNPKLRHFVTREDAAKITDACPDVQWRTLFVLARFGGLRIPSEALLLKWSDIDWARGRIRVTSPKTERHERGAIRTIPLFPELRQTLTEAFEQAPDGSVWVIDRYRDSGQNLRTHFRRIIARAGLQDWPKPWQNLRVSRATELAAQFPVHVSSSWMGHGVQVAAEHYLTVRDEDFERAVNGGAQSGALNHASGGKVCNDVPDETAFASSRVASADVKESSEGGLLGVAGLEPATSRV